MSKIICEVCGTAYPETSTQCPICGSVHSAGTHTVSNVTEEATQERVYQHVKGGRFSKSNVRKRTSGNQGATSVKQDKPARTSTSAHSKKSSHNKNNGNMGLVIAIFALLLAIIAVVVYILIKFIGPNPSKDKLDVVVPSESEEIVETGEVTEEVVGDIYCQNMELNTYELYLEKAADYDYLIPTLDPIDTTETVIYESADSSIAMAEPDGRIVAVRKGETVVTVTCGIVTAQCKVVVGIPQVVFELDSQEVSLLSAGETVCIYTGEIAVSDISWSSDDSAVATVADGVVTAIGPGTTTVYGDYNGQTLSCVVRCEFPEQTEPDATEDAGDEATEPEGTDEPEPTEPEETQAPSSEYTAPFALKNLIGPNSEEVSLSVGESFSLALIDSNGTHIKGVTWTVEGSSCTVSDGTVKAVRSGNCVIVATYGGQTYKCRIIVW